MMRAARDGADRGAADAGLPTPLSSPSRCCPVHAGRGSGEPGVARVRGASARGLDGVVVSGDDVRGRAPGRAARSSASWCPASVRHGWQRATIRCACSHRRPRSSRRRLPRRRVARSPARDDPVGVARGILLERALSAPRSGDVGNRRHGLDVRVCRARGPCVYSPGSRPLHRSKGARDGPTRPDPRAAHASTRQGRRGAEEARGAQGRAEVRQANAEGRAGRGRTTTSSAR